MEGATATVTALVEALGYENAQVIAVRARAEGKSIREIALAQGLISTEEFDRLISPESVTRLGSPARQELTRGS